MLLVKGRITKEKKHKRQVLLLNGLRKEEIKAVREGSCEIYSKKRKTSLMMDSSTMRMKEKERKDGDRSVIQDIL